MNMGNRSKCGPLPLLAATVKQLRYIEGGDVKEVKVLFVYCSASGCGQPYGVIPARAS